MEKYQILPPQKMVNPLMWMLITLVTLASLHIQSVDAQSYFMTQPIRTGVVMARAVVLDENGQPILVEYNEDGTEGAVVSLPAEYKSRVTELQIIPASEYHQQKKRLSDFKQQYADNLAKDAELLSRQQYEQNQFPTADGKANITQPKLAAYVKSVLIRGRSNRILNEPSELVLLNFSVDLTQNYSVPEKGSVVLNPQGQVIASSTLNIAPRAGFFGKPDEKQSPNYITRKRDDKVFGPVDGVLVHVVTEVFRGGVDVTDGQGKYTFSFFLPPCPGFDFDYTVDVYADLHYMGFTPNGAAALPYTMRRQSWSMCIGSHAYLQFSGNLAGLSTYLSIESMLLGRTDMQTIDFKVDVMFLSGRLQIGNQGKPIPVGETTEYEVTAPDTAPITQAFYDFDHDGKADTTALGEMVDKPQEDGSTKKVFEAKVDGTLQAVYLSSNTNANPEEPDLLRQADTKKNLQPNGLLKSISKDDLKKTDVLIFRESTGQLVLERRGMGDEEVNSRRDTGITNDNSFFYRLMLRGPTDSQLNIGAINRSGSWQEWASNYKMTEPFQKREADHLKSGEWIRVVAINRVTGYMATQRVQLKDASQNGGSFLNVPLKDMMLMPPNLKVWAERSYDVDKGLTKNEERQYLIGAEGAALTSDTYIRIFTEWLDEEGRTLPEDLGKDNGEQYGLTGRLAKVATENVLTPVSGKSASGSDLANFPIAPGRQTQVLRLSDNLTTPEHFYIHVSGTQKDENPNFGTGSAEGILSSRPEKLTPFLTPLYDENKDWKTYNAYRDIKREQASQETPVPESEQPIKPLPAYAWSYRPEYQFSQYKLEVDEINRVTTNEYGSEEKNNILNAKTPLISSSDQLVEVLYSLFSNTNNRLSPIDGPQDLILTLGEQELKIQVGEDKQIRFNDISKLGSLSPEDFLTLRLYTNQDAGNILWEYAFEHVILIPNIADNVTIEIPADENRFAISAVYLGYASRSEDKKLPNAVLWEVDGNFGYFSPSRESAKEGVFSAVLNTTRTVTDYANHFYVKTSDGQKITGPKFKVVPGQPDDIQVKVDGKATISGRGSIDLTVTVKDKHGNKVADGTEVKVAMDSDLVVEGNGLIINGETKFVLKGYHTSGQKNLILTAGKKDYPYQINITPVNLMVNVPSHVTVDSVVPITITADADGIDLNGLSVELRTDSGKIKDNTITLSSGSATTQLSIGKAKGIGNVIATLAGELAYAQYTTESPENFSVAESVLVGDRPSNGSVTIDKGNGETFEQEYVVSTEITVKGNPGEVVPVEVGDLANPPVEPLAYYNMNNVYGDQVVGDAYGMINAEWQAVEQSTESNKGFEGSYQFNESSQVTIPTHSAFQKTGNIGIGFEAKISQPGIIVNFSSAGQTLELLADGRLRFTVKTENSDESIEINNVTLNEWHKIGAHLRNGKLQLQVDEQRLEKTLNGTVKAFANPEESLRIGGGFQGLLNQFRVIDWNAPILAQLPNGDTKMNVVIGSSGTASVTLSSTGKMGQRTIASYDPRNPLGLPIQSAFADSSSGGWWGRVTGGLTSAAVAFVDAHNYAAQVAVGFARGLVLGDTSTPAGLIGDMVLGFIPFGDSRDVILQNYYKNYGNPEDYDEVTLYLAYIGLGADALMLVPATTAVGTPLNAAIAIIKPLVKLIKKLPLRGVLAKELENLAQLALAAKKSGRWEPFVEKVKMFLPFMQLFAAVAIDEDLRNLLANAIRNSVDFDNWLKYISAAPADLIALEDKYVLIPDAYAGMSGFKQLLRNYVEFIKKANIPLEKAGNNLADSIHVIVNKIGNDINWKSPAHKIIGLKAFSNVIEVGGKELIEKLSKWSKFGRRTVDDVVDDLANISLSATKMDPAAIRGYRRLIGELAAKGNKAKGAVHHLQVIRKLQEKGYKILNVEAEEIVEVAGTRLKNMRRYDVIVDIGGQAVRVECKSWNPENIVGLTKRYLKAGVNKVDNLADDADEIADAVVEGQQLFADILSWQQKGFKGHQWHFDDAMKDGGALFKETLLKELKSADAKKLLKDILKLSDDGVKDLLNKIKDNLDSFIVITSKV